MLSLSAADRAKVAVWGFSIKYNNTHKYEYRFVDELEVYECVFLNRSANPRVISAYEVIPCTGEQAKQITYYLDKCMKEADNDSYVVSPNDKCEVNEPNKVHVKQSIPPEFLHMYS